MKKRKLSFYLSISLILIIFFSLFLISSEAKIYCYYKGPDTSEDNLMLSNFSAEGPSDLRIGDKIRVKFNLTNVNKFE